MPYFSCILNKCIYLFLILVLIQFSCSNRTKSKIIDNYSEIKIKNNAVADTMDISNMIESVKLLKLTDAPHKPLGAIYQLYAGSGYYVAFDKVKTKRANAYDVNGNYLKTLMENGPKKSDALTLFDCYVNQKNEVILYDFAQMKVTILDSSLTNEKTIKNSKLFHYDHIASLPGTNNFVGYASNNLFNAHLQGSNKIPSNLDILSSELGIVDQELTYDQKFEGAGLISLDKSFFPFKDSLRFLRVFDPFIYSLSKQKIERRYKIVYENGNFPSEFLEKIVAPHLKDFQETHDGQALLRTQYLYCKGYTCPRKWIETDDLIYLASMTFSDNKVDMVYSIIIKNVHTPTVLTSKVFTANKKFQTSFPAFDAYDKKNNELIAYCTGNQLKKYLNADNHLIKSAAISDESFYLFKAKLNKR